MVGLRSGGRILEQPWHQGASSGSAGPERQRLVQDAAEQLSWGEGRARAMDLSALSAASWWG